MPAGPVVCSGCGTSAAPRDPYPFRCPRAGSDDVDHVMVPVVDLSAATWPDTGEDNPFVHYRTLLHSWALATSCGLSDAQFVDLVRALDARVATVDGHAFHRTPFGRDDGLSDHLGFAAGGGVWVKHEAGNVAGSHKARHLMGVALHLEVVSRLGLEPDPAPDLAIASCGNAALAAAVVAAAAGRALHVFVPPDAEPSVLARLRELGADVVVCAREPGVPGDPCYLRLRAALTDGLLPFTCQGNENGLSIEGGRTLSYEMVDALSADGLEHVVVQVGGGALASAVAGGFADAVALGALAGMPRVHTVQTEGAHPLERAYTAVRRALPDRFGDGELDAVLRLAAAHRSQYMWPWEQQPKSVAHGILDDETYDWRAVVTAMLRTGGRPVVVSEELLQEATELANRSAPVPVDATAAAGLAGLLRLRADGVVGPGDRVAVLVTGARR